MNLATYEDKTQHALTFLALIFLVIYAGQVLVEPTNEVLVQFLNYSSWAIWGVFLFDYLFRIYLATDRMSYFKKRILELFVIALPMLRPLRSLRVLSLANLTTRKRESEYLLNGARIVAASTVFLVLIGALGVLDAERNAPDANITNFGDALWWSFVTITTVGFGEYYPVTFVGRTISVIMMFVGIALVGVITAGFASWFLAKMEAANTQK